MKNDAPRAAAPPNAGAVGATGSPSNTPSLEQPIAPDSQSSTLNSQPPPHIPDHELLRRIGRGSYGDVWLARNVLGEFRAVKVVYRDRFEHERPYEREFDGIRKFEPISRLHESQVDILHVGRNEAAGYFYYVMELADNANVAADVRRLTSKSDIDQSLLTSAATYSPHTLKLDLHRRTRLPVDECLTIGLALTTAVQHLHEHGLVHRDIKPSNIIFVHGVPKLADIGLVASMYQTMSFVGTSGFLPPEGPGTPQGDLYSLGKVLYEISMGRDRTDFPKLPPELLVAVSRPSAANPASDSGKSGEMSPALGPHQKNRFGCHRFGDRCRLGLRLGETVLFRRTRSEVQWSDAADNRSARHPQIRKLMTNTWRLGSTRRNRRETDLLRPSSTSIGRLNSTRILPRRMWVCRGRIWSFPTGCSRLIR